MLKRSLAWVLSLALLISAMSGLALMTSAAAQPFSLVTFISGKPSYNPASEGLAVNVDAAATDMESITGNPMDRSAYFMSNQNAQLGVKVPASAGLTSSNITIEVKFWTSENNLSGTRMGMNFKTGSHNKGTGNTDYTWITMSGAPGAETVQVASDLEDAVDNAEIVMEADDSDYLQETGWKILRVELNDAAVSGAEVNIVNWTSNNGDGGPNASSGLYEGWYVQRILVYDTDLGKPNEAEIGIREDVIGYYDYDEGKTDEIVLDVKGGKEVTVDDTTAVELTKADGYKLNVTALQDVVKGQPAVLASEARVTFMAEVKDGDTWKVLRRDVTDNAATEFEFGELLFNGNVESDTICVRKVVIALTKLISKNSSDSAYVDFDNPFYEYDEFNRVTSATYKTAYSTEGTLTVQDIEGRTAIVSGEDNSYFRVDVEDAYTMNGQRPVADYRIDVTYLDKGTGDLNIQYNKALDEGEEENNGKAFANQKIATLTNDGEWKTATVYLSDAQFRNAANGSDLRVVMNKDMAVSNVTVTIGADKAELTKWVNKKVNEFAYTSDSVAALKAAQNAAAATVTNKYAPAADVASRLAAIKDAYDALVEDDDADSRFDLTNAIWVNASKDAAGTITAGDNGEVVKEDGWFCWQFTPGQSGKYIGIAPEDEDFFADSTSVTYEYDIKFVTTQTNDRCFLGNGTKTYGWTNVNDKPESGAFNGFAAHGNWGATPAIGKWGTIRLINADFSNDARGTSDNNLAGAITTLGAWMSTAEDGSEGELFVRGIKVYDTKDPSKFIELKFNEDAAKLSVTPSTGMELTVVNDFNSYVLDSADKSLTIGAKEPIESEVVKAGENNVVVAFDYYLDPCTNADEKITLTYGDKTATIDHEQLSFRGNWVRTSFQLTDAAFAADKDLVLKYENGSKLAIRGVRVFACDADGKQTSEKAATWGNALLTMDAIDHAYVNWSNPDVEDSYGLTVRIDEGDYTEQPTGDRNARVFTDAKVYVSVDRSVVSEADRYVRVDITHLEGDKLYIDYNYEADHEVNTDDELDNNLYNFHASGANKEVKEVTDEDGTRTAYTWITDEETYVNPLGVIRPTMTEDEIWDASDEGLVWVTTSIYLEKAQFRGAANGADFRIVSVGQSAASISAIDVRAIDEAAYNEAKAQVGDMNVLIDAIAEAKKTMGAGNAAVQAAEEFVQYNYRASQADIDKAVDALKNSAQLGDVNGDGKVDSGDALQLLRYAAEIITKDDLNTSVADLNGDGKVDSGDALLSLQYAAEIIHEFPAGK